MNILGQKEPQRLKRFAYFYFALKLALMYHFFISFSLSFSPALCHAIAWNNKQCAIHFACSWLVPTLDISVARLNLHVHRSLSGIWASISIENEERKSIQSHCWTIYFLWASIRFKALNICGVSVQYHTTFQFGWICCPYCSDWRHKEWIEAQIVSFSLMPILR